MPDPEKSHTEGKGLALSSLFQQTIIGLQTQQAETHYKGEHFKDKNSKNNKIFSPGRRMSDVFGFQRSLFPYPNSSKVTEGYRQG